MSVVSEANAQEPWESEDVLWQEELPAAEGDPTAEESWARWAGGGDYAPGDGGGRWRHPLDLPMRMLRLAGLWRPRDVVWKKGERPRDILYHVYAVIAAMLFVIFTGIAAINIKYSMDDMGRLTDVLSLVTVGVFNGAKVTAMFFRRRRVERCLYLLRASLRLGPPLESRSKTIENFERRLTIIANGMGWTAVITCAIWMTAPWLGKLMSLGKQREPEVEFNSTTMAGFTVEPTTEPPHPRLPFDLWFPLDLRDNLNYALGMITQLRTRNQRGVGSYPTSGESQLDGFDSLCSIPRILADSGETEKGPQGKVPPSPGTPFPSWGGQTPVERHRAGGEPASLGDSLPAGNEYRAAAADGRTSPLVCPRERGRRMVQ